MLQDWRDRTSGTALVNLLRLPASHLVEDILARYATTYPDARHIIRVRYLHGTARPSAGAARWPQHVSATAAGRRSSWSRDPCAHTDPGGAPCWRWRTTKVGMSRTLIGQLPDAEYLRRECRTDGVEQVRERSIARPLPGSVARARTRPRSTKCASTAAVSFMFVPVPFVIERGGRSLALVTKTLARIIAEGDRVGAEYVVDTEARRTGPTAPPRALRGPPLPPPWPRRARLTDGAR